MTFDEAFTLLVNNEGVLSLDRRDRGNWTSGVVGVGELKGSKYGVSAMSYPSSDISRLTIDEAKKIYKRDYWDKMQLDLLPDNITFDMFDIAVNSGVSQAIKLLQTTVGSYPDGKIGQLTLNKTNSYGILLRQHLNAHRLLFYTLLSSWKEQGKGWTNRVANNLLQTH
jgi:lysozyme family protein